MDLQLFWFFVLGVLLTGYAILDGFDLGVGIVHLGARTDTERRIFMNAIGPIWDGNEVWLVTFGGALFAAFPPVYATVFSGFYTAFMLLLCALIFRAVSMEFRSKQPSRRWRATWDFAFFASSTLATFLFGVAVGNAVHGLPIGPDGEYAGTFLGLLTLYPIMVGLLAIALFAMHGSIYLYLKTEGELQQRVHGWIWRAFAAFVTLYVAVTAYTVIDVPTATANFKTLPLTWVAVVLNVLAIANIPRAIYHGLPGRAFVSSCATIAALVFLLGMAIFPDLVVSNISPQYSLTIQNSSSSTQTLALMRTIAFCGMPFVLAYTAAIYWAFRGKVKLGKHSY
ncbi:MAG: cytochrome d ubiquinol oxidase subunit II [Proteobacteria bacterium]|nr:cytochrome d ubiquinol oxidase subunit II [Pseudomonadota bacterium]